MNSKILIGNNLFGTYNQPETSKIHIIGTIGFTILSCMILDSHGNKCITSFDRIKDFTKIAKKETMVKYIKRLVNNNLISIELNISSIKPRDSFMIDLSQYFIESEQSGYELIPSEIFISNYKNINHIGWTLFCFLAKMHNSSFGGKGSSGFVSMNETTIGLYLDNIHRNTINKHIENLRKNKLIKVTEKKNILNGYDEDGNEIYQFVPSTYAVRYKINS